MTRIRVNPAILNQSSSEVSNTANQIHKIGEDVWRSATCAPSYDGQFGPKLHSIGQNAMAQAQKHSSRISGHSGSLSKRASAFLAADAVGEKSFSKPAALDNFSLMQVDSNTGWLTKIKNKINQLLNLGNLGNHKENSVTGNLPVGFVNKRLGDGGSTKIVNALMEFERSEVGRKLAADAVKAGIVFVVMENGISVQKWGSNDPSAKIIPIGFEKMGGSWEAFNGMFVKKGNRIIVNQNYNNLIISLLPPYRSLDNTLSHEMKHAIDWNKSYREKLEKIRLEIDVVDRMSKEEKENYYAQYLTLYAQLEVNAFDVGFAMHGGTEDILYGSKLDSTDGIYTKEEYDFVINDQRYGDSYEIWINEQLKKMNNGKTMKSSVWVDDLGNIKVTLSTLQDTIPKSAFA